MEGSNRSDRFDRERERRGAPPARLVAAHLQNAAAVYGISSSNDQIRELKSVIEREKEKKKASRALIEQLQHVLNARDEQVRVLSSQLVASQVAGAPSPQLAGGREREQHENLSPDPVLIGRIRELERENAHLRGIAVTLQSQRDAFEHVARSLQAHSAGVEASYIALQGESKVLLRDHLQHATAFTAVKKTLNEYEGGLTNLVSLLAKQQMIMRT